jgi:hypothetical protein
MRLIGRSRVHVRAALSIGTGTMEATAIGVSFSSAIVVEFGGANILVCRVFQGAFADKNVCPTILVEIHLSLQLQSR